MSANFGKIFGDAFHYPLNKNRFMPFLALNIAMYLIILILAYNIVSYPGVVSVFTSFLVFFPILIIYVFLMIFLQGSYSDNARYYWGGKVKPINQSYPVAKSRYLSILGALVLSILITIVFSIIPIIGFIIAIVLSWFFMFIVQFVIIAKTPAVESLKQGYRFFMNNKLDVIVYWVIAAVISLVLFLVALIPIIIAAVPLFTSLMGIALQQTPNFSSVISLIRNNFAVLAVGGFITTIIFTYMQIYTETTRTFFFMDKMKKKKFV